MRTEKKVGKAVNDKPWKPNNAGHAGFLNKPLSQRAFAQERRVANVRGHHTAAVHMKAANLRAV